LFEAEGRVQRRLVDAEETKELVPTSLIVDLKKKKRQRLAKRPSLLLVK